MEHPFLSLQRLTKKIEVMRYRILPLLMWLATQSAIASSLSPNRTYDLCLGYSALANGREAMAGEGYSIEAALRVCENDIAGCVAISFDRMNLVDGDLSRCRFYKNQIEPSYLIPSPPGTTSSSDFQVVMSIKRSYTGDQQLPKSCVACTGPECL